MSESHLLGELVVLLALAALGMFCVAFGPQVETSTSARNEIIRRLCRFFGLQLNDKGNGIDLKPFRRLHMVPGYQRVRLNHVLWSRASGYDLQMTEATLQARRSRRLPLMHPYRVLFHGILVSFRIPDKVDSDLILLSHKRHAELASKGETLRSVQSGHPALDKTFKIVATKPAAAARLLSQPVADVLMRNAEALDSNALQCAISGDRIYFTMATKRRWFGGSRSTDFVDIGEIRHFVADIAAVFELAHAARTIADGAAGRSVMTQAPSEPSVPAALATPGLSAA